MEIQQKMMIGGVGIKADRCRLERSLRHRDKAAQQFAHAVSVLFIYFATNFIGADDFPLMVQSHFHSFTKIWEPIEELPRSILPKMNWTNAWAKQFRAGSR